MSRPEAATNSTNTLTIVHRESGSAHSPWAKWTAVSAHLAVAVVAATLFVFAKPLADDYCSAANPQPLADYVAHLYRTWSGRWFSHGFERFVLTHADFTRTYGLLVAFLGLFFAAAVYLFARSLFRGSVAPRLTGSLSCSFLVLFWCLHPSLGQSFYWFTGAVEYQLVISLSLVLFAVLVGEPLAASRGVLRGLSTLGLALLAFLITGMHELFAAMLCVVLAVGVAVAYRVQHRNRVVWVAVLAAGAAGFLVSVAAPGNLVRTASFAGDRDWLMALWLAPWQAVKAGTAWIFDLKFVAATAVFLVHPSIRMARPGWLDSPWPWKRIIPVTWLVLLAIGFAMPSFAMGQEMPGRARGGIFFVFLFGWFLAVFVWTRDLRMPAGLSEGELRKAGSTLLVLFSLSVLTTGNARHAIYDLIHTAPAWDQSLQQRYELIRAGRRDGIEVISVPPASPRPRTFFQGPAEITSNWSDWKNDCMANFFDVPAVQVVEQ